MLEKKVSGYVKYWAKQLRIQDWVISIKEHTDPEEFHGFASIKHHFNSQTALLEYLDPQYIPEDWTGVRDLEVSVVHELLHTRFIWCIPTKKINHFEEQAIEQTAQVLVALRRGVKAEDLV